MINTHRPNKTEPKGVYIKDMLNGMTVDSFENVAQAQKKVALMNKQSNSKRYRLVIEEGPINE